MRFSSPLFRSIGCVAALMLASAAAPAQTTGKGAQVPAGAAAPVPAPATPAVQPMGLPSMATPHSAPTALAVGEKFSITTSDVLADVQQRVPAEAREQLLARSATVGQVAGNLYARRGMAAEAEAQGLAAAPEVEAALRIARERILSDVWIARIDAQHQIDDAVAERLARNTYRAKPERFVAKERVRVRHILTAGVTPESRAQAEKLLEELKGGADFAKLAEQSSADKGSAAKGGDLGLFERGRMVPPFEEAAFALKQPGDMSGVVESQFGYHILKLEERKPEGPRPFEEVRDDLMKEVRASVQQDARVAEAQRLQKGMKIQQEAVSKFSGGFKPADVKMAP